MAILEMSDIVKVYRSKHSKVTQTALDRFNLKLEERDFIGIMGPSGSGKTTLLNIAATIDSPSAGRVIFRGKDITGLRDTCKFRKNYLGFVFQDHNLLDTLTIEENIALPLTLKNIKGNILMQKIRGAAEALGIADILKKYPYENSGGQKQRAAIARAIAGNPDILLADEPTGALDSQNAALLMRSLEKLQRVYNSAILLVTHDPLIASYCRRIIFIKDGKNFSEIVKSKDNNREEFYGRIIDMLSALEGGLK